MKLHMDGISSLLEGLLRGPAYYLKRAEDPAVIARVCNSVLSCDRVTLSREAWERHVEPMSEVDEK